MTNPLSRLWAAFGSVADAAQHLAASLSALAASLEEANGNVRKNLALDPPAPPALTEQAAPTTTPAAPEERKGRKGAAA